MLMDPRKSTARGHFLREDTLQPVRWVRWYDTETLEYEAFRYDPVVAERSGVDLRLILYRGRAKLRFIQTGVAAPKPTPKQTPPAELTRRGGIFLPPSSEEECEVRGCHKRATRYTHDVEEIEPEQGADGRLYERTAATVRHYFCEDCFRLPLKRSLRGVDAEVQVGVRNEWKSL